jgi:type II secretory pathway pseudopilin PulG
MAALLVGMSVMAVVLSVALPVWRSAAQREREAELIFRGEQYARAVELFQRKYAGAFPPNVEVLLNERFLRRRNKDPVTNADFQLLYAGQPDQAGQPGRGGQAGQPGQTGRRGQPPQLGRGAQGGPNQPAPGQSARGGGAPAPGARGGILGVASTSRAESLRLYNGRGRYNEWTFVATQASTQGGSGARGSGQAGQRGRGAPGRGMQQPGTGVPQPRGISPGLELPARGQRSRPGL